MEPPEPDHLHALVDMGSNGIRLSITSLAPPTARILPTLYTRRIPISLYDAQFSSSASSQHSYTSPEHRSDGSLPTSSSRTSAPTRVPIPQAVITRLLTSLRSFKRTVSSFHIPASNVHVVATEATRTAPNGGELCAAIERELGWSVTILSKEEEGRLGAKGVLSSFDAKSVTGVVADLGGGSVQLSWVENGELGRSVSLPFGAAALMARVGGGGDQKEGERSVSTAVAEEVGKALRDGLETIGAPPHLLLGSSGKANNEKDGSPPKHIENGCDLYLSGGGFRGWGYMLLSSHRVQPYPIPMVGGFSIPATDLPQHAFHPASLTSTPTTSAAPSSSSKPFRVSSRRAAQTPAIALLAQTLLSLLPQTKTVHFAQGGVREGYLFSTLPASIQAQPPLQAATAPYASPSATILAEALHRALPPSSATHPIPPILNPPSLTPFLTALSNLISVHAGCTKDIRPSAALRCSSTGILAGAHGLSHAQRALLGLALLGRWGGPSALPPVDAEFYASLMALVGGEAAWLAGFAGAVAGVLGEGSPAGLQPEGGGGGAGGGSEQDGGMGMALQAEFAAVGKKGKRGVLLRVRLGEEMGEEVRDALDALEKWGKKKSRRKWTAGEGWKVRVLVEGEGERASGSGVGE